MSSSSSNAPNGLPWLAEDNSVEWQEQVMAYLQQKQLAQYVEGWASYLAPSPPTVLTDAERVDPTQVQTYDAAVTKWRTTYEDWRIKDNMAMGVIKGTLRGQYLTYVHAILGRLKTQNLGLAAHNTKQLLYSHPYLGGPIEEYLKHFIVMNEQLAHIGKALPDADVAHWMLENLPKDDPSWKSVISSFYTVNPDPDIITTLQASVAIRNHYNQLTAPSSHSTSAYIAPTFESVFAAHHGRPPSGPNWPYCNGCKKPGHMVENCFESILAEIGKLNARLPHSLQLSMPSRPERANVVLEGGFGVVDDRDTPGGDDDVALLSMALSRGEVFVSTSLSGKVRSAYRDHVYVDSGATCSISLVIEYFDPASLKQLKLPVVIHVGNNDTLLATAAGDMPFLFNVGDTIKRGVVTNVLYCADIATTLISASQLNACGNRVVLDGSESRIIHKALRRNGCTYAPHKLWPLSA
jgi:hypothetical protein